MTGFMFTGRRVSLCLLLILTLLAALPVAALAAQPAPAETGTTIKDRIKGTQGDGTKLGDLEKNVDQSTDKVVTTARRLFVTLTLLFGLWLGITYLRAGFSPDTLKETKGRIMFFILFLVLSFWTESILGAVFSFFGVDLTKI